MKVSKQHINNSLRSVWGGSNLLATYDVTTAGQGFKTNHYEVVCQIRGLSSGEPELQVIKVTASTNNEDTLIAQAIAELCGWECGADVETETTEAA